MLSLLFVIPSARLWLSSPLVLIPFEFDYWLGLFSRLSPSMAALAIATGRIVHLLGFLLIGAVFWSLAHLVREHEHALGLRWIAPFAGVLAAIWVLGMPWVSPDVFFYIGTGWLDGHYGLSPYLHAMAEAPGAATEGMFANVFPGFVAGRTAYGPLFHIIARTVALLSGGRELAALGLFKLLALGLHAASCALVWRLTPSTRRLSALVFYSCNPLVLFSLLTCAHNDGLMISCLLLALYFRAANRPGLAGALLAAGVASKYAPLLLLPLFLIDLMTPGRPWRARLGALVRLITGFAVTLTALYQLYPGAANQFMNVAAGGIHVYRNSIYGLLGWFLGPRAGSDAVRYLLQALFVLGAAVSTLVLAAEARLTGRFRLLDGCLIVWSLYFVLPNQTNQEWYLAWLIPLAAVSANAAAFSFGSRLSFIFLPLVIFTVKNALSLVLVSNLLLYLVLAGSVAAALPRLMFPQHNDDVLRSKEL